ncbi:Sad1/UNC-like carboxy-terminal protein [Gregarina niphandrodes]|uniref:Sad1/UNC-like carboxy-terminal protein n=1 Tax=Gregarina niphandrodes TaxID=110365 RepID=A0A023BD42_GRENI|nr:Sad1/UNC-like carboxy-terminal protein [Gregarina niphandrodes]EZG86968.1 Sad1/UNC-like carboxy-terminal protein [Gregarina niphandrodes]|eukprot:XP_011128724.1 Sad1/UNC-like carboxy-terminal protein [Gregarina niphandrodes]
MGAAEYPTESWRLLAIVELDPQKVRNFFNLKDVCSRFESGACWMSHIKFQVLSYYPGGASDVCTLSRFQVYGSTLMQGLETKMKTKPRDKDEAPVSDEGQECKQAPAIPKMVTVPYHYPPDLLYLRSLMTTDHCLSPLVLGQERELLPDQARSPLPWTRGILSWNRMREAGRPGDLERTFAGDARLRHVTSSPPGNQVDKSFGNVFADLFDDMFGAAGDVPANARPDGTTDGTTGGTTGDTTDGTTGGASPSGTSPSGTLPGGPLPNKTVMLSPAKAPLDEAISKLLARVLADSHVLNEESRSRQELDRGSEVPPILALVDRLNDMQKALGSHVDKTLGLTVILRDVVDVLQTVRQETGALYREIKDGLWPEIAELGQGFQLLRAALIDLLRSSCASAFRSYALIEPRTERDRRRTTCVLSEILALTEEETTGDDRLLQLLEATDYGTKINEWNLGAALNLYIDNLRQTLHGSHRPDPGADEVDEDQRSGGQRPGGQRPRGQRAAGGEGVYRAALLYLDAIGPLHWPRTFLHIVRLPRWNSARLVLGHPLVLYFSILTLELYNVFGQLLLHILASAIYLFVVANAYLQFESTTEPFKERYHQFIETFRRRERLTRNNSDGQIRNWSSGVMDEEDQHGSDLILATEPVSGRALS